MYIFKFRVGDVVVDCFELREILRRVIDVNDNAAYYVTKRCHPSGTILWENAVRFESKYVLDRYENE